MNFELSQHAHTALTEREISTEWLERAFRTPMRVGPDKIPTSCIISSPSPNTVDGFCGWC